LRCFLLSHKLHQRRYRATSFGCGKGSCDEEKQQSVKKDLQTIPAAWVFQAAPSLISCTDFYAQRISAILKQRFPLQSPREVEKRTKNRSQTRSVKDMKSQQLSGSSCNPKNHDRQAQLVRDNNITTNGYTFSAPASSSPAWSRTKKTASKTKTNKRKG
jgi:hypothetical protein